MPSKNRDNDDVFKEIAKKYTEFEGEQLKEENRRINAAGKNLSPYKTYDTVKTSRKAKPYRRLLAWAVAAAACLVMIFALSPLKDMLFGGDLKGDRVNPDEIIPLSFELSGNLTISKTELDNGMSVYYLDNSTAGDDVVMTLEYHAEISHADKMETMSINGQEAYYKKTGDYNLITFIKEDMTYTLSCKSEFETILELGKIIL